MSALDKITDTVNSMLSALKMPDESTAANQILANMKFPQFSRLLPYRDYDEETGLFMNATTMGFVLEAQPLVGANVQVVESLENLLRTKMPRGIPLSIHLMSSKQVGEGIEYGLREFSWSGEQAPKFNAITGVESEEAGAGGKSAAED